MYHVYSFLLQLCNIKLSIFLNYLSIYLSKISLNQTKICRVSQNLFWKPDLQPIKRVRLIYKHWSKLRQCPHSSLQLKPYQPSWQWITKMLFSVYFPPSYECCFFFSVFPLAFCFNQNMNILKLLVFQDDYIWSSIKTIKQYNREKTLYFRKDNSNVGNHVIILFDPKQTKFKRKRFSRKYLE